MAAQALAVPVPPPTEFLWLDPGTQVVLAGSFTNWMPSIKLAPFEFDHEGGLRKGFRASVELPPGFHFFKFLVDDEWRVHPNIPYVYDEGGNENNYLRVTVPQPDWGGEAGSGNTMGRASSPPQDFPRSDSLDLGDEANPSCWYLSSSRGRSATSLVAPNTDLDRRPAASQVSSKLVIVRSPSVHRLVTFAVVS